MKQKNYIYSIITGYFDRHEQYIQSNQTYYTTEEKAQNRLNDIFKKTYPTGFNCNTVISPRYNDLTCKLEQFTTTAGFNYCICEHEIN